ncbi:MAG: preprotein translocase subunit YajC [Paludibacteraceae bacterium]|jgi:preprotein translocase subunit YajC|nr:preprotein translocase subunit YajC [Paludibacteraceae bacterium]MDI9536947.1 preprotein translocase subunit YajC [Bacteroidota bacterium]OQC34328.1 MAG: preprotein translocase subunit YajC [Bacteroidetes bacterium ADurb.Bin057]HHT61410.1 preprotein translocase subunit YajC [Bacteroidales bacterium]MBP9039146.1 preprotein translocase subunit YajC [Paludibacteraceae bacterium]
MNLTTILLQAQAGAGDAGGMGSLGSLLMIVLIFVVFYFFMIRPQSKRQKEIKKFQDSLQNGKNVVTSGGIYGKIKEVKENTVIIEVADGVRIKVNKNMVFDSPEDAAQQTAAK